MTGGAFALTILIHNMFADEPRNLSSALVPFSLGALSVPVLGGEALYYRQYNKRHERRTIEEFQAHQLRQELREQLLPKYFQPVPLAR
jgi:hypothetical protein